ncbi:MAG: hypothetical protein JWP06_626 [Candidatus Saccharibacteria bacterium]|nr:hypothetical protein [Candidatus Saccharibacteria bacterium]
MSPLSRRSPYELLVRLGLAQQIHSSDGADIMVSGVPVNTDTRTVLVGLVEVFLMSSMDSATNSLSVLPSPKPQTT